MYNIYIEEKRQKQKDDQLKAEQQLFKYKQKLKSKIQI